MQLVRRLSTMQGVQLYFKDQTALPNLVYADSILSRRFSCAPLRV